MNKNILHSKVQEFIASNLLADLNELALKGVNIDEVTSHEVLEQIQAKNKAKKKLPAWFETKNIYYPPKINLEQTSSGITGKYKASLVQGKTLIDLTGGFGVDSYYFSKVLDKITHCEIDENLSVISKHNFKSLGVDNVITVAGNGITYLEKNQEAKFDWIYLDPGRRDGHNNKVFRLQDTTPNILYHLKELFLHTDQILLKTSPLLDITLGIKHLEHVAEIHVVALNNEVKELLWVIKKDSKGSIEIKTRNFKGAKIQEFDFCYEDESNITPKLENPLQYLYEANAAIMKSGGFSSVGDSFSISKFHLHSHLYTSNKLMEFPGRRFEIISVTPYQKKMVKRKFGRQKHNVTTRNFTLKVSGIRHLFQIQDGGESYLFFTTNKENKKIVVECRKI